MMSTDLDFKLLETFQCLLKTRRVSAAGDMLGVSQPTVSRNLARLRSHFNDPLFVRTHRGMEPTPCATELASAVDEMLALYHSRLSQQYAFDPATSRRTFNIAASEIGHALLFPPLVERMSKEAPDIQFKAVPLGLHSLIDDLETGAVDIAFGAYPKLFSGVYERTVGAESYVCVAGKKNPGIGRKLSFKAFSEAHHVIVSAQGLGHIHEQIERQLLTTCPAENVRVISHHFLATMLLVEQTNLIATVPSRVASLLGERLGLRVFKPPLEIQPFDIKVYWHERYHKSPANQWLRSSIAEIIRP